MTDTFNIGIDEVHKLLMEGLSLIDDCAKKNGIVYFLHAGTVLGSIRHKSFIPWDDDADIIVPAIFYSRFVEELQKTDLGKFEILYRNNKATKMQAKLVLKGQDEDLFCIDIFPLIGASSEIKKQIKQCKYYTRIRKLYAWRNNNWRDSSNSLKKLCKLFIRFLLHVLPNKWFYKRFDKILYQYNYDDAEFVTNPCGKYKLKNVIPKKWYGNPSMGLINGKSFPIPSNYVDYLKKYYSDYNQLPSEEYRNSCINKKRLFRGTEEEYRKCIHQ